MPGIKKFKINPHVNTPNNTIDVVAFDRQTDDWGIFSNYAPTPITMTTPFGNRRFPTVEHYFQYMKDPTNQNYLDEILINDNPQHARDHGKNHFADIEIKQGFSARQRLESDWRTRGADAAMNAALDAKLAQHAEFAEQLILTKQACLVEDTGTRSTPNQDGNWGLKLGGATDAFQGTVGNKLGIMLMEKRNQLYQADPKLTSMVVADPTALSNTVKIAMQTHYSKNSLVSGHSTSLNLPEQPVLGVPTQQPLKAKNNTAKARVLKKLKREGVVDLEIVPNMKNPNQSFVKICFSNSKQAGEFDRDASHYIGKSRRNGNTVIMDADRAQALFTNRGIGIHGKTNQYNMFSALAHEHRVVQKKIMQQITAANPNETATEKALSKLRNEHNATDMAVDPNQQAITLYFKDSTAARDFVEKYTLPGIKSDGNRVQMNFHDAQQSFHILGIGTHGNTTPPRTMIDALSNEHQQAQQTSRLSLKR